MKYDDSLSPQHAATVGSEARLIASSATRDNSGAHVSISSILPEYLLPIFPFHTFNAVQSGCLATWRSDSNILISSPTGSGKTVVFEFAICRVLHTVLSETGRSRLGPSGLRSKVVYIAPIRALCAEKAAESEQKFSTYGLRVQLCTGDLATSGSTLEARLSDADLILTTAGKWGM